MAILETDPLDLRLTEDGDLYIGPDGPEFVRGLEGVAQLCRIAMLTLRGEWFLDLDVGIPLLEDEDGGVTEEDALLGQQFDPVKADAAFRQELLSVPCVRDITYLQFVFDNATRILAVQWAVSTEFGDTEIASLEKEI